MVNGIKICRYIIDFKIIYPVGEPAYIEVKGRETSLWRLKWKLAQALYPEYNFKVVK